MLKILFVEDNVEEYEFAKKLVKETLSDSIFYHSEDAEDALVKLSDSHMDVLFIDVRLPGMSGLDLAHKVRNMELHHVIPIVFITGNEYNTSNLKLEYGNYEYILKPYTREEFHEKMDKFLISIDKRKKRISENSTIENLRKI